MRHPSVPDTNPGRLLPPPLAGGGGRIVILASSYTNPVTFDLAGGAGGAAGFPYASGPGSSGGDGVLTIDIVSAPEPSNLVLVVAMGRPMVAYAMRRRIG